MSLHYVQYNLIYKLNLSSCLWLVILLKQYIWLQIIQKEKINVISGQISQCKNPSDKINRILPYEILICKAPTIFRGLGRVIVQQGGKVGKMYKICKVLVNFSKKLRISQNMLRNYTFFPEVQMYKFTNLARLASYWNIKQILSVEPQH